METLLENPDLLIVALCAALGLMGLAAIFANNESLSRDCLIGIVVITMLWLLYSGGTQAQ